MISFPFEIKGFSSAVSLKIVPRVVRVPEVFLRLAHSWMISRLARDRRETRWYVMCLKSDQGSKIIWRCQRRESSPFHEPGKDKNGKATFSYFIVIICECTWGKRQEQTWRWEEKRGRFGSCCDNIYWLHISCTNRLTTFTFH